MIDVILLPQNGCTLESDYNHYVCYNNIPEDNYFGIHVKLPCLPKSNSHIILSDKVKLETLKAWWKLVDATKEQQEGYYFPILDFIANLRKNYPEARRLSDKMTLEYFFLGKKPGEDEWDINGDVCLASERIVVLDIDKKEGGAVVFDTKRNVVFIPCLFGLID